MNLIYLREIMLNQVNLKGTSVKIGFSLFIVLLLILSLFSFSGVFADKQDKEFEYSVSDAKIGNDKTKKIMFPNLKQEYSNKNEAEKEGKTSKDYLKLEKTEYFGKADVVLKVKKEVIKQRVISEWEDCVGKLRIDITESNETGNNTTIKRTIYFEEGSYNNFNETEHLEENEIILNNYIEDICEIKRKYKNYTAIVFEEINPETFKINKDTEIFEVFEGCTKIQKLLNGKFGCSVWTDVNILGINIKGATWWNESWEYKVDINISTIKNLTNYPTIINLNSSNTDSNFDWSNNNSIRFVNSTNDCLNYWVESWDSSGETALIWVKVNNLIGNTNTTIKMYYGNSEVSSESNGKKVFSVFDDFSGSVLNTSIWNQTSGNCTVGSGILDCPVDGTNVVKSLSSWGYNYSIIGKVSTQKAVGANAMFGFNKISSGYGIFYYSFSDNDYRHYQGESTWGYADTKISDTYYHNIRLVRDESGSRLYIDHTLNTTMTDNVMTSNGTVMIQGDAAYLKVDWVAVAGYMNPEPIVYYGNEISLSGLTVALNSPDDNQDKTGISQFTFNCSVTDEDDVSNLTLRIYNYTGGLDYSNTTVFAGNSDISVSVQENKNLGVGKWTWNYIVYDNDSYSKTSSTRNIYIRTPNVYYKEIEINKSSSNETINKTVQLEINLSLQYSMGKIVSDCSNLYFTDSTGNSNRTYCIPSCDLSSNDNATFKVLLPEYSNTTNTTIRMYYGNVTNGDKDVCGNLSTDISVIYQDYFTSKYINIYDDFNDGTGKHDIDRSLFFEQDPDSIEAGYINESNGILEINSGDSGVLSCWHVMGVPTMHQLYSENTTFKIAAKWESENDSIAFGFSNDAYIGGDDHAFWRWNIEDTAEGHGNCTGLVAMTQYQGSANRTCICVNATEIGLNVTDWNNYSIIINSTKADFYVNGVSRVNVTTNIPDTKLLHTHFTNLQLIGGVPTRYYHDNFSLTNFYTGWNESWTSAVSVLKNMHHGTGVYWMDNTSYIRSEFSEKIAYWTWNKNISVSDGVELTFDVNIDDSSNMELWLLEATGQMSQPKEFPSQNNGIRIQYDGSWTYDFFKDGVETANQGSAVAPDKVKFRLYSNGTAQIYESDVLKFSIDNVVNISKSYMPYFESTNGEFQIDDLNLTNIDEIKEPNFILSAEQEENETTLSFTITSNYPTNETKTNDNTTDFNFNVSGSESSYNCVLYLNHTNKGSNATTSNDTATTITSTEIPDGFYNWYVNCTAGGVTNQSEIREITIDTTPPTVSSYYQWNSTNGTVDFGVWTEGFVSINWNLTDSTGINTSTCNIKVRNKNYITNNTNLSYINDTLHPDYDPVTGYKNLTCYTEDLGDGTVRVSANLTRSYDWRPLSTAFDQDNAAHDNAYYNFGGKATKMVFHNITSTVNTTFIFMADIDNQSATVADQIFYSCNLSYTSGDFTTSPYCTLVGAITIDATRDINFGYVIGALTTDENGTFGGVVHTETMYGISYCPLCTNTGNAWITYSTDGYSGHSETSPNKGSTWSNLVGSEFNVILHVIDNTQLEFNLTIDDNIGNQLSDLQTDIYGPLANLAPYGDIMEDNVTGGLVSYYDVHNITETGTIWINTTISDPNEDSMNCSVYLLNYDSSLNQTLLSNYSINGYGICPYEWDTTTIPDGNYRLNVTATDGLLTGYDESAGYIRIDNTNPTSNSPSDDSYMQNTSQTIGWILQDKTGAGNYTILRNGSIQNASTSWTNNTNLNIWVNTSTIGNHWNYTIKFNDSLGNEGTPDTVLINITAIVNNPPVITANSTSPSTVYTNTDLLVYLTATDADAADTLTGYTQFYINGTSSGSVQSQAVINDTNTSISTLSSANFNKSDTLTAEVWVGDGADNTTKVNMSVVVNNSIPSISGVDVTPNYPTATQNLTCIVTGWSDADSDTNDFYFKWYKNSVLNSTNHTTQTTVTLDSNLTLNTEVWKCEVIPYDSEINGTLRSDSVTIGSTAPVVTPTGGGGVISQAEITEEEIEEKIPSHITLIIAFLIIFAIWFRMGKFLPITWQGIIYATILLIWWFVFA